ncbi:MAG: DUF3098 domain-containing protein [Muribaculaceae bacterium]|nr:DUF3098 domain-containing protein [Muribaculaceae bacterium]
MQNNNVQNKGVDENARPFVKKNFIYMSISLLMIVVGFLLMTGSANGETAQFNNDIFSARRIVIGPTLAFLGFVAMAFAILYTPKNK